MIHSSRRDRRTKAVTEVLAMIAAAQLAPNRPLPVRETDERLEESATKSGAASDRYFAEHMPGLNKPPKRRMD
jgi:hypothetical protein